MPGLRRLVLLAVVAVLLWFGYRRFFPDDDARIRRVLDRMAAAVDGGSSEDGEVSRLARAASIRNQLDPQVTVDAGPPFNRMSGRDAIIGTIARMRGTMRDLEVEFSDVQVRLDDARTSATVLLTAEARYSDAGGARGFDARELDITFRKLDDEWVVAAVRLVRTLEPLTSP